jgi:hypothetical protein
MPDSQKHNYIIIFYIYIYIYTAELVIANYVFRPCMFAIIMLYYKLNSNYTIYMCGYPGGRDLVLQWCVNLTNPTGVTPQSNKLEKLLHLVG